MRKSVSLLVLGLLVGTVGCEISTGDEDDDGQGQGTGNPEVDGRAMRTDASNTPTGDAGSSTPQDASAPSIGNDASSAAASDAGIADTGAPPAPTGTSTYRALAECVNFITASAACAGPDVFEPNDQRTQAIALETRDGCALVPGKLSSNKDVDWFSFSSERADPVRVRLGYEATPTSGSDLHYEVRDPMDGYATYSEGQREDLTWSFDGRFVAKKGLQYSVRVFDRGNGSACSGYNLQVETNFCTDAFEDNDSKSKAVPGIAYGAMISATLFSEDEDWYDVSALQAAGATCTIGTEIGVSSTERVDVEFRTASDGYVAYDHIDNARGQSNLVFTLKAGSGMQALRLRSNKKVCTKYTVLCNPL